MTLIEDGKTIKLAADELMGAAVIPTDSVRQVGKSDTKTDTKRVKTSIVGLSRFSLSSQ